MRWFYLLLAIASAGAVGAQPTIAAGRILNTSGDQPVLAPGAVWVLYGNNLGPAVIATATGPDYPTSVSGTSATFTPVSGGSAIQAKIWYALSTQVGGFLPSSAAPGNYNVTVTYNGQTSAAQSVTVAARSMGIGTSNGLGTGFAQATIANVNGGVSLVRLTSGNLNYGGLNWVLGPAHPGDEVVLWGTGGGADAANDPGPAPGSSGDQTKSGNFVVTVGARQITPDYAGTVSGYPGLWQINVHLPSDIEPDCFAPVQVTAGGNAGNLASIAIAPPGAANCSDSQFPLSVLSAMDSGRNLVVGAFALAKITAATGTTQESGSGFFGSYTPLELALPRIGPKFNGCEIFDRTYPVNGLDPASPDGYLDAGRLAIAGLNFAAGSSLTETISSRGPTYSILPASGTITPATYTMSGAGGTAVGTFTATTIPGNFTATNWNSIAVVNRSTPLTFTWTASGLSSVYIEVNSLTTTGSTRRIVTMNCVVPAAPGTFTIPTTALAYLPPAPASGSSFGTIALEGQFSNPFTAPLTAGGQIDLGLFVSDVGYSKNISIQ
ncbi:MAG TPA: hypothetical protein VKX39_08455 [Bryobacteraceae bacterium]|nr:hypothetical protein [Bryobacteraceae bacterium]